MWEGCVYGREKGECSFFARVVRDLLDQSTSETTGQEIEWMLVTFWEGKDDRTSFFVVWYTRVWTSLVWLQTYAGTQSTLGMRLMLE